MREGMRESEEGGSYTIIIIIITNYIYWYMFIYRYQPQLLVACSTRRAPKSLEDWERG